MTHRLYYDDSYCREFDASVVRVEPRESRQAVWLDRSAFYPTSGGQPFDTGRLGGARVVDVQDEDGDVVHYLAGPAVHAGTAVHGRIDWDRRFDHMQQHTGQHILSAAFSRLLHVPTVGFHLGAEESTIDLAREVSPVDITVAEGWANQIVWDDRPVGVRYAGAEEAASMGLRKESHRTGTLRLVDIEQCDLSACGGSHVTRTGAIGIITVNAWERFKGGQRVEFSCGGRALTRGRSLRDTVAGAVRRLSVLPHELPSAIERLQADIKEQKREMAALQSELAKYRAQLLVDAAETMGTLRLVRGVIDEDVNALKGLATAVAAHSGHCAILVSAAAPRVLVVAGAKDVTVACDQVVRAVCARFGGRGGGKPDLAQAGGLEGGADQILAEAGCLATQPQQ